MGPLPLSGEGDATQGRTTMNKEVAKWFEQVPTIDTNQYASGDLIGTLLTFDLSCFRDSPAVLVQSAKLIDKASQAADIDALIFDANPATTVIGMTNNAALAVDGADLSKIAGVVQFTTYLAFAGNALGIAPNVAEPIRIEWTDDAMQIYALLVSRGTPTYAAATDLALRLGIVAL